MDDGQEAAGAYAADTEGPGGPGADSRFGLQGVQEDRATCSEGPLSALGDAVASLVINPNTVLKPYRELEVTGLTR
jgi:hypothetical protein